MIKLSPIWGYKFDVVMTGTIISANLYTYTKFKIVSGIGIVFTAH